MLITAPVPLLKWQYVVDMKTPERLTCRRPQCLLLLFRSLLQHSRGAAPILHTVKKGQWFSGPQPGCHLPNSPCLAGIIKLFPPRESLVSDIPAGDRKTADLFYSVRRSMQVFFRTVDLRQIWAQSRQSAKLFLQSSELGLPQPLTRRRVCPPPPGSGGRGTHSGKSGVVSVPILTTYTVVLFTYIYVLWGFEVWSWCLLKFCVNL